MKRNMIRLVVGSVVMSGLLSVARAEDEAKDQNNVKVVWGAGFVISPGYNSVLQDAYPDYDVTGGYGWLDLMGGVRFTLNENVALTPAVDLLVNAVSGDETFVNTIIVPSVSGRYTFNAGPSFFVSGELNLNSPHLGGDRMEAKSGGIGAGASLGYAFDSGLEVELGYKSIPVDVTGEYLGSRTENLGGFVLRLCGTF